MLRRLSLLLGSALLSAVLCPAPAHTHEPGGYHHGGGYHYGGYHYGGFYYPHYGNAIYTPYRLGLYAPYGFRLPAYTYAGPGWGFGGLGVGGLGGYGLYRPYYGGAAIVAPPVVVAPPATAIAAAPPAAGIAAIPPTASPTVAGAPPAVAGAPAQTPPPPDNAAHLQLLVPENAEVLFDGGKTSQTGPIREFVSPQLTAGKLFDYTITVRYAGADGKTISDRRVIHVRANDWFRIDFTHPAPPEPVASPSP